MWGGNADGRCKGYGLMEESIVDERESIVKRLEWGGAGGAPPRCWTVVPIFIKIFIFNRKNKNLGEKMYSRAQGDGPALQFPSNRRWVFSSYSIYLY